MVMGQTSAIVLAAGMGKRMNSLLPKPLHPICGRAMILHVLDALTPLELEKVVVVVGHGSRQVIEEITSSYDQRVNIEFVEQHTPQGTGDAVKVALTCFSDVYDNLAKDRDILILPGDAPLVLTKTLAALIDTHRQSASVATLLSVMATDPTGYGRIIRNKDKDVARIVEEKDATEEEKSICEVGTSIYVFRQSALAPALRILVPKNAQNEYYLTDVIEVFRQAGYQIKAVVAEDEKEVAGVNDRLQLAFVDAELRKRINTQHMLRGVTIMDPSQTYIDKAAEIERDVTLMPGTVIKGATYIGSGSIVGPYTVLDNCYLGQRAHVTFTYLSDAKLEDDTHIGPYGQS